MILWTVGTQDFRLIWNEQELTNLDINEIHCWIESFTKWNPRISVADGRLHFGKLLNFENGNMEEVGRTSQTCLPLGKAANQPRICTIRGRLHGICTTQTSMKDLQIQHFGMSFHAFLTHTHDSHDVLSRSC